MLQNILSGRLLGVEGLGLLATIMMFISIINKLVSFRMSEMVIKYVGQFSEQNEPERAAGTFKIAAIAEFVASIIAFLLVCIFAPLAAHYLTKDQAPASWFMFYGLIILANLIAESSTGLLQIFNRYRKIATLNVWGSGMTLACIFIVFVLFQWLLPAFLENQGMTSEVLFRETLNAVFDTDGSTLPLSLQLIPYILTAYLLGKFIGAGGLTVMALREARLKWGQGWWQIPISALRPQYRELTHFAVSTNISASLSLINKDAEIFWISLFRNPSEVGYYKTALSLINIIQLPISPLPQATYPELSRDAANSNWVGFKDVLRRGSLMAGGFSLLAAIILFILGQQVILLLYNDPSFLPAYPALIILIPGFLVANTFFWNRVALLALGRPDFPTKLNLILAGLKLLGVILLVPRYGYLINAALLSASYLVGVSIAAWKTYTLLAKKEMAPAIEEQV